MAALPYSPAAPRRGGRARIPEMSGSKTEATRGRGPEGETMNGAGGSAGGTSGLETDIHAGSIW